MKISELSYRDYIAIECIGHCIPRARSAEAAAHIAYQMADAMLAEAGKHNRDVEEQRERAEKAERSTTILRNMNEDGQFAPRIALEQIWVELGVDNQTAAMIELRKLVHLRDAGIPRD